MKEVILWHNTTPTPLYCGYTTVVEDKEIYLVSYGEILFNYLSKVEDGYFDISEPYGFPFLGFKRLRIVLMSDGPRREDEPFIFRIYPKL